MPSRPSLRRSRTFCVPLPPPPGTARNDATDLLGRPSAARRGCAARPAWDRRPRSLSADARFHSEAQPGGGQAPEAAPASASGIPKSCEATMSFVDETAEKVDSAGGISIDAILRRPYGPSDGLGEHVEGNLQPQNATAN